jgi:phage recombination protein Bet
VLGLTKTGELRPINDLKLFMAMASQYGLNPFKKEIYATYVWDSSRGREELTPIVSIHGLRKLARQGGVYTHTGVAEVETDAEGNIVSASVPVFGQWDKAQAPVEVTRYTALFDEFKGTKKDGNLNKMWSTKPRMMLVKCAEANAIRQGFDISGIYIEEEIARDNVIDVEPEENDGQN